MNANRIDGYLPLEGYGCIGDCRSAALVGLDGSIDWLCLPRFDNPSIFGRIIDAGKGGYWQINPHQPHTSFQRYRDRSNIVETIFTCDSGRIVVTDFMPVHEATIADHAHPHSEPRVIRLVECVVGSAIILHDVKPAPGYGLADHNGFRCENGLIHGDAEGLHLCVRSTVPFSDLRQVFRMSRGDSIAFSLTSDKSQQCPSQALSIERARELLRETQEYWWQWSAQCTYDGPYQQPVIRSALALKMLTYAPTGAIIAAPTTSLPELVGGIRNWDYRFTWLRDAAFTLYAFFQLGFTNEANDFFRWLAAIDFGRQDAGLQNLYTVDGGTDTEEKILAPLDGYRHSRPVRIGNGAANQLQLDVYGEVLDSAYLYARFGGNISQELWRDLRAIVNLAVARWELPDASIWEVRGQQQHYTYSKFMCWVAIDRGLRLAERFHLPHEEEKWKAARAAVHRMVTEQGFSAATNSFVQVLGTDFLDASILRMSQVRFLRGRDPRMLSTITTIADQLSVGDLVRRYQVEHTVAGVSGSEGAFLLCSFWLVDALAHVGELERAEQMFARMMTFASPLGLFAEEADMTTGALLGNFPQAFTHLSLVGAAVNIERARKRKLGVHGLK